MFSRRSFMQITSVAAAAKLTPLAKSQSVGGNLPPSIAALTSMTSQVRPITNDERKARIEKARRLMTDQKFGAIILSGGTSSLYFANLPMGGGERLWALVLPAKGKPFLVCPAFENDRAHELLASTPFAQDNAADIRTWQENESPYVLLAQGLKDRGVTSGRVGIEETVPFVFADGISHAAGPSIQVVSATPITAGCRMIKDEHEIACLRLAGQATLRVYEAVYHALSDGMTQRDVMALIQAAYARVGFPGEASLNIGEYTASPHGSQAPQTIREGTILMLDDGCRVEGYTSDITRTFVLGKPTGRMLKVFEIVQRAQKAALAAAKPGAPNEAVDAAARAVIVDAGYGPGFTYFTHRVGHGLGMDMHEWNYLAANNMFGWNTHPVLQPGMVFSDEPGIYIRGEFGVRLEDDMLITKTGAELLTPPSPSLEHPFG
jgi:Xaa-Pro dipeptidase